MTDLRLAVMGAAGRMGLTLVRAIHAAPDCHLTGASEAPGHPALGADIGTMAGLGTSGVGVTDDLDIALAHADAVIDFTTPDATLNHLAAAAPRGLAHIIGTTGFTPDQEKTVEQTAATIAIVKSGNMSLGVNLLAHLTRQAARILNDEFDIEVLEMHHRHKVDAPSGTALLLGAAAAEGRGVALDAVADRARDGHTGARKRGDIGFAVLRGGGVVGDHTVILASESERIELTHRAGDRGLFAQGALRAARWSQGRPPGLYSMADVLGF